MKADDKDKRIRELENALMEIVITYGPYKVESYHDDQGSLHQRYSPSAVVHRTSYMERAKCVLKGKIYKELVDEGRGI